MEMFYINKELRTFLLSFHYLGSLFEVTTDISNEHLKKCATCIFHKDQIRASNALMNCRVCVLCVLPRNAILRC